MKEIIEELKKVKMKYEMLKDVTMTIGIHPLGCYPDDERKKVTEEKPLAYKAGWNDAIIEMSKKIHELEIKDWGKSHDDVLFLMLTDNPYIMNNKLYLNMNDTFAFACADAEEVPDNKIKEVADLYRQYGYDGLAYWVSKQRDWEMPYAPDGPHFKRLSKAIKQIRKLEKK